MAALAYYQLRQIGELQPFLEKRDLAAVAHALITYRLDDCNVIYMGLPLKMTSKLELVQNVAACMLLDKPIMQLLCYRNCISYQLPLGSNLVITDKALNGLDPGYLRNCCPLHISAQ